MVNIYLHRKKCLTTKAIREGIWLPKIDAILFLQHYFGGVYIRFSFSAHIAHSSTDRGALKCAAYVLNNLPLSDNNGRLLKNKNPLLVNKEPVLNLVICLTFVSRYFPPHQ